MIPFFKGGGSLSRTGKVLLLSSTQLTVAMISIVSGAILTRVLPKAEFASYRQAMLVFSFAAPFVVLGLDNALYAIMPRHPERSRSTLVENLILLALSGALLALFILVGGNHLLARRFDNPSLSSLVLLLAPYALVVLPTRSVPSCLMARDEARKLAAYNTMARIALLPCVVVPAYLWPGPVAPLVGQIIGAALSLMVGLKFMFDACGTGSWWPTIGGMKEQLRFAVPTGMAGLVGTVAVSLDHVIVSSRFSPETYAAYAVGAFELPVIGIFTGAMTSVLLVEYSRLHASGNYREIVRLVHQAMFKSALVLIPIMVLCFVVAPSLMVVLFGDGYRDGAGPFRWYLLRLPLRTLTFGALLMAAGRGKNVLAAAVAYTVGAGAFSWVLAGWFGPSGSACGMALSDYLVSAPMLLRSLSKCLAMPASEILPWKKLAQVIASSVAAGVPIACITQWLSWPAVANLAVCSVIFSAVVAVIFQTAGLVSLKELMILVKLNQPQSKPA